MYPSVCRVCRCTENATLSPLPQFAEKNNHYRNHSHTEHTPLDALERVHTLAKSSEAP